MALNIVAIFLTAGGVIDGQSRAVIVPFQTFSLAIGGETIIQALLLDRFLACMKPASKT
jgi:hypothetical protein